MISYSNSNTRIVASWIDRVEPAVAFGSSPGANCEAEPEWDRRPRENMVGVNMVLALYHRIYIIHVWNLKIMLEPCLLQPRSHSRQDRLDPTPAEPRRDERERRSDILLVVLLLLSLLLLLTWFNICIYVYIYTYIHIERERERARERYYILSVLPFG